MRYIFLYLAFLVSLRLPAQSIQTSIAQKVSNKTPYFKILGKSNAGIFVYKYGKSDEIIELYTDDLKVVWAKPIPIKYDYIENIIAFPDYLMMFYVEEEKDGEIIKMQKLNNRLENKYGEAITLDTSLYNQFSDFTQFKVIYSQDKSKILVYRAYENSDHELTFILNILNDIGAPIQAKSSVTFPKDIKYHMLESILLSNEGEIFFSFKKNEFEKRHNFDIYVYSNNNIKPLDAILEPDYYSAEEKIKIDNINKKLIITGIYSENSAKNRQGIYTIKIDYLNDIVGRAVYNSYAQVIDKVKDQNNKADYKIGDILLTYEGGVVLVLENVDIETRTTTIPNLYGYYSTTSSTYYYYKDLLIVALNEAGELMWKNYVPKNQVSEKDKGYYSSYMLTNTNKRIHMIYNAAISSSTRVIDFTLSPDGELSEKELLNTARKEIMLVPQYGKQLSATEILVPSISRNYFKLVKFKFNY